MSEVLDRPVTPVAVPVRAPRRNYRRFAVPFVVIAASLVAPFYVDAFWLQVGLFGLAAVVAALGLGLLLGHTGQLSLGHAFFVAVGSYGYTALASEPQPGQWSLGLPPPVAAILAVVLAGAAGLMFSPIAARLRGIYLGIASLAATEFGIVTCMYTAQNDAKFGSGK